MQAFNNVDEYIAQSAPVAQPLLKQLRTIIKELAPQAEERISYGMPGYFYNGALVYFGGFKNHVSFFGAGSSLINTYKEELRDYKTSKGTIQFPLDQPLPVALIKKLVATRLEENKTKKK